MNEEAVTVPLAHGGWLHGALADGVRAFLGIPFAQAPTGPLRWARPRPAASWVGMRDALAFAPVAPQITRQGMVHPLGGEAFLALNVWAPAEPPGEGLPVMVWVHGGGFMRGSAAEPLYDGAALARRGVMLVSLQYRLGIDGFLHLPGAVPNRGLLDLLEGLKWVQTHIGAFGGDPARVTVFGESAGAGAVACLLGMETADGLFQQAILQSPSVVCHDLEEAARTREAVAEALRVDASQAAIEAVPICVLLRAVQRLVDDTALRERHGLGFRHFFPLRPVVDGEVLQAAPLSAMARRWAAGKSAPRVLVGSNAHEMRLYHVPHGAIDRLQPQQVSAFMAQAGLAPEVHALYQTRAGTSHPGQLLCEMQSDGYYRLPARQVAALAAQHGLSAFLYEFEWPSPQWSGRLGAAHGVELPFVFGNLQTAAGLEFTGPQAPPALAEAMQTAWVGFARDGVLGWPAHRQGAPWRMRFDAVCAVEQEPVDPCLAAWPAVG